MGLFTGTKESYYEANSFGGYQFIGINDIINNFIIQYVGEDKIISKVKRTDVAFHARRAIQEFTYDVFRVNKAQEIEIPPSLVMKMPHDYVDWVKVSWTDSAGLERRMYPNRLSSNPKAILQDNDYNYLYDEAGDLTYANESTTWTRFKDSSNTDNDSNTVDPDRLASGMEGGRYGLDPEFANSNGVFYVDEELGTIHFSSNVNGKIVTLKYLSDGLAEDGDMYVHKFAEEAVYKWIAHGILASRSNTPEYLVARFRRERTATRRVAKLRLSKYKLGELTQVMRGKSKRIKH
jgi:hypothetical protein